MSDSKMVNDSTSTILQRESLSGVGQALWSIARWPALALLVVLEPLARFVLAGSALCCLFMAFFFKWTSADPRFPFWGILLVSITLAVALFLYEGLVGLLSRR